MLLGSRVWWIDWSWQSKGFADKSGFLAFFIFSSEDLLLKKRETILSKLYYASHRRNQKL